jgi:hypothetical protein
VNGLLFPGERERLLSSAVRHTAQEGIMDNITTSVVKGGVFFYADGGKRLLGAWDETTGTVSAWVLERQMGRTIAAYWHTLRVTADTDYRALAAIFEFHEK